MVPDGQSASKLRIYLQKWPNFEAFDLEGRVTYSLDKGHFEHVSTYTSDLLLKLHDTHNILHITKYTYSYGANKQMFHPKGKHGAP